VGFTRGMIFSALRPAAWALATGATMLAVKNVGYFKIASLIVSISAGAVVFLVLVLVFEGRFVRDVKEHGWTFFQDLKGRIGSKKV